MCSSAASVHDLDRQEASFVSSCNQVLRHGWRPVAAIPSIFWMMLGEPEQLAHPQLRFPQNCTPKWRGRNSSAQKLQRILDPALNNCISHTPVGRIPTPLIFLFPPFLCITSPLLSCSLSNQHNIGLVALFCRHKSLQRVPKGSHLTLL